MKPKHALIITPAIALALSLLVFSVFAHGGRTDSNGGHYVSGTGEYHYHHGYQAHFHEDIDGDGTLDCPFDFDDQTGTNSGSSNGSGESYGASYWDGPYATFPTEPYDPYAITHPDGMHETRPPGWSVPGRSEADSTEPTVPPPPPEESSFGSLFTINYNSREVSLLEWLIQNDFERSVLCTVISLLLACFTWFVNRLRPDSNIVEFLSILTLLVSIPGLPMSLICVSLAFILSAVLSCLFSAIKDRAHEAETVERPLSVSDPAIEQNVSPDPAQVSDASERPAPVLSERSIPPPPPPEEDERSQQDSVPDSDTSDLLFVFNGILWDEVAAFRKRIAPNLGLASVIYLWESYFYCAVRVIHSRPIAEQIYSLTELSPAAQAAYARFRDVIHHSGIDPRTHTGLALLWSLALPWIFPKGDAPFEARSQFMESAEAIMDLAALLQPEQPSSNVKYSLSPKSTLNDE